MHPEYQEEDDDVERSRSSVMPKRRPGWHFFASYASLSCANCGRTRSTNTEKVAKPQPHWANDNNFSSCRQTRRLHVCMCRCVLGQEGSTKKSGCMPALVGPVQTPMESFHASEVDEKERRGCRCHIGCGYTDQTWQPKDVFLVLQQGVPLPTCPKCCPPVRPPVRLTGDTDNRLRWPRSGHRIRP